MSCRVIAIMTNKGGVLKTSLTTNIAGVLAQKKKKVLIIDSDNQGNVGVSFGLNPDEYKNSIYDVLLEDMPIKKALVKVHKNIDIVIANDEMNDFELNVLINFKDYDNLFNMLEKPIEDVREEYDYILVDTAPNLGLTNGNVLAVVDEVIIPFQAETYSMRSLIKAINSVNNFRTKINKDLGILGVVGTLIDSRTVLHSDILSECRKFCYERKLKIFDTVIPRSVRFANSIAYKGKPATLTNKNHPLVNSYFELVKEMGL